MTVPSTFTAPPPAQAASGLPGAIGLSRLSVYDTETVDGLVGGTPHMHLACSEAYAVISGHGRVQTLDGAGAHETPLQPGALVWFGPGTIHRLVNDDALEIVVLMQNDGLPEAGDAVLTMPADVLADPARYAEAVALAHPHDVAGAQARRDRAVAGFHTLRDAVQRSGPGPLDDFYAAAAALVAPSVAGWRERFDRGARATADATAEQLDALAAGRHDHLWQAVTGQLPGPADTGRAGMCGRLAVYPASAAEAPGPAAHDLDPAPSTRRRETSP